MVIVEEAAVVECWAWVSGHALRGSDLVFSPVRVGFGAVVGPAAQLAADDHVCDQGVLTAASVPFAGQPVRSGEVWEGTPARRHAARA